MGFFDNPVGTLEDWGSKVAGYTPGGWLYNKLENSMNQGGGPNPADAAMKYLDQIPGQLKDTYNPYMQQGQDAYSQMNPAYSAMTKDPAAYLDNLMKGYAPSKSYQLQKDEMLRSAGNTAAAGGMRGTGSDVTAQAKLTDSLLGDDMQKWLSNVMGVQGRGLQGLGNFYDTGFNAAKEYGGDLSNVLGTKAQLAFQGQSNQNQSDADRHNRWMNILGPIIGGAAGAGAKAAFA